MGILIAVLVIGLIIFIIMKLISKSKDKVQQMEKMLYSIPEIKRKIAVDKYTILIEKEDLSYALVGIDRVSNLDNSLNGSIVYHAKGREDFTILFNKKIGIVNLKWTMKSSLDIKYIDLTSVEDVGIRTIYRETTDTKKQKKGMNLVGHATGGVLGTHNKTVITNTTSEHYDGTAVDLKLHKKEGQWFSRTESIVFQEETDAVKLKNQIKELLN